MGYINRFQLIQVMLQHQPFDSTRLLATVNKHAVIRALQKTKDGVPKSFRYTNEPMEEEHLARMPQHDKEVLWELYDRITEVPDIVLPQLNRLHAQYPNVPCISNYLAAAYAYNRQDQQCFEMLCHTRDQFPDYLFGKISLAEYYVNHNDHRKVPGIFDRKFEIYHHYPTSIDLFHISEVRSFYSVVGRYFARSNKLARAIFCYFTVEEVAPDHWTLRQLGHDIVVKEIEHVSKDFAKHAPKKRTGRTRKR